MSLGIASWPEDGRRPRRALCGGTGLSLRATSWSARGLPIAGAVRVCQVLLIHWSQEKQEERHEGYFSGSQGIRRRGQRNSLVHVKVVDQTSLKKAERRGSGPHLHSRVRMATETTFFVPRTTNPGPIHLEVGCRGSPGFPQNTNTHVAAFKWPAFKQKWSGRLLNSQKKSGRLLNGWKWSGRLPDMVWRLQKWSGRLLNSQKWSGRLLKKQKWSGRL